MKTKRTVGIIALIFVAISFIAWMLLIFTRAAFSEGGGFSIWVPIVFLSFFISIVTAVVCLAGDAIRFAGKMFSSGFNGTPATPVAAGGVALLSGQSGGSGANHGIERHFPRPDTGRSHCIIPEMS